MASILGEFVLTLIRSTVAQWIYLLWMKLATRLDPRIKRRWLKVAVGGFFGIAAFFLIPIVMSLLGL